MNRKDIPNAAFAFVNADESVRLLRHHNESVQTGDEHTTVNPLLLHLALESVEFLPMDESARDNARRHLRSHANVVLWQSEDVGGLPIALHDKLRDIAFFRARMDGIGEVPPVTTEARGGALCMYNKRTKEFSWMIQFEGMKSAQRASHFHIGKGGKNGPIAIPVDNGSPSVGSITLSEEQVKDLFEGNMYLNIHSEDYPIGEIRGQVLPAAVDRSNNAGMPMNGAPNSTGAPRAPKVANNPHSVPRPMRGQDEDMDSDKKKKKKREKNDGPSYSVQIKPKKEPDPKAHTPHLQPGDAENDNGAIYSKQVVPPESPSRDAAKTDMTPSDSTGGPNRALPPAESDPSPEVREPKEGTKRKGNPNDPDPQIYSKEKKSGILESFNVQVLPPKDEKPKAEIYEGFQTEPNRKSGGGGPDQIVPPKDVQPQSDVRQPNAVNKGRSEGPQPLVNGKNSKGGVDFAQPLVNIDTRKIADPKSEKTRMSIIEFGNSTGAPNPPPVADDATKQKMMESGRALVSISNLSDPNNADLRNFVQQHDNGSPKPRPGTGNKKLRSRVIQLLDDTELRSRVVIFPSAGKIIRVEAAHKNRKSINQLPDAAFAVIERGGKKDEEGKTAPRDLRHLPHHTSSVKSPAENSTLDLPRLRNALARMNQIKAGNKDSTDRIRGIARRHLVKHAKVALPSSQFAQSSGQYSLKKVINEIDIAICKRLVDKKIPICLFAQLNNVEEIESVKLFRLDMGTKDRNFPFFVQVRFSGSGDAEQIMFDFDTRLPAKFIPDFMKFLKSLPKPSEED